MPQTINLPDGEHLEVVTPDDLEDFGKRLKDGLAAQGFRYLVTVGLLVVLSLGAAWATLQARVSRAEEAIVSASAEKREAAAEIRQLVKKVDSLTVVMGNVNDVLGDIKARLR